MFLEILNSPLSPTKFRPRYIWLLLDVLAKVFQPTLRSQCNHLKHWRQVTFLRAVPYLWCSMFELLRLSRINWPYLLWVAAYSGHKGLTISLDIDWVSEFRSVNWALSKGFSHPFLAVQARGIWASPPRLYPKNLLMKSALKYRFKDENNGTCFSLFGQTAANVDPSTATRFWVTTHYLSNRGPTVWVLLIGARMRMLVCKRLISTDVSYLLSARSWASSQGASWSILSDLSLRRRWWWMEV